MHKNTRSLFPISYSVKKSLPPPPPHHHRPHVKGSRRNTSISRSCFHALPNVTDGVLIDITLARLQHFRCIYHRRNERSSTEMHIKKISYNIYIYMYIYMYMCISWGTFNTKVQFLSSILFSFIHLFFFLKIVELIREVDTKTKHWTRFWGSRNYFVSIPVTCPTYSKYVDLHFLNWLVFVTEI